MNNEICKKCKFIVTMYGETWQYCNKYMCKLDKVQTCDIVQIEKYCPLDKAS